MNAKADLDALKEEIEQQYPVKVDIRFGHKYADNGIGGGLITFFAFAFGAISGGFLSEIGKDLWIKIKHFGTHAYQSLKHGYYLNSLSAVVVSLEYKQYQIIAVLEIDKYNKHDFETLYKDNVVDFFCDGLLSQLISIINIIDEMQIENESISFLLNPSTKKRSWVITKHSNRMTISECIKNLEIKWLIEDK